MKIKLFFLLIAGFAVFMFSCSNRQEILERPPLPPYESHFSQSELLQINAFIEAIPIHIKFNFEDKYSEWQADWGNQEINIPSDLYVYADLKNYDSLLIYCNKHDKVVWPLLIDKVVNQDSVVINLLKDVTYSGNPNFYSEILKQIDIDIDKQYISIHTTLVDYCKNLIANEKDDIFHAIQDITYYFYYTFTQLELDQISTLIDFIPVKIRDDFEAKYKEWEEAWTRPPLSIQSSLLAFGQGVEYENLVICSSAYGKVVWPLIFDKFSKEDKAVNLVIDITYDGADFVEYLVLNFHKDIGRYISSFELIVAYCKDILASEKDNMIKAIIDYEE